MISRIFVLVGAIDNMTSKLSKQQLLQELKQLAEEIRSELSSFLSNVQKSYKASLAVVELTVALHHVFHAPVDKILWDAGEEVGLPFLLSLLLYFALKLKLSRSRMWTYCDTDQ